MLLLGIDTYRRSLLLARSSRTKELCQLSLIKVPLEFLFQLTLIRERLAPFQPVLRRGLYKNWAVSAGRASPLSHNSTHFLSSGGGYTTRHYPQQLLEKLCSVMLEVLTQTDLQKEDAGLEQGKILL